MSVEISNEKHAGLVPAGSWQLDPAHSSIEFQVKHLMIATVKGRFTDFEGTLEADENGTLTATGTIRTASIDTHEAQRDEHLRSADFFDAATHPQISFASSEITPAGSSAFLVAGDLTIKGLTRRVELSGSVQGTGRDPWGNDRIGLELRGQLDRSDFGLTWNQALETGGVLVGDRVKFEIEISAVRQAASAPA